MISRGPSSRALAGWAFSLLLALRLITTGHSPDARDAWLAALLAAVGASAARHPAATLPRRLLWALAAFVGVALVSSGLSLAPYLSWLASPTLWTPLVVFLGILAVGAPARQLVLGAIALAGTSSALVGAYQVGVAWPALATSAGAAELPPALLSRLQGGRALGLSLSPDLGGALALGGLAACATLALDARKRSDPRWRLLLVGAALCGVGVVLSRSAGVALAGALAGMVWALLRIGPRLSSVAGPRRALVWAALGLGGAGAGGAAVGTLGRGFEALAHSADERLWNWAVAWDAFGASPLVGHGVGRFASAYAHHQLPGANITRYAHSLPLHTLVELGMAGVCAALLCVGGMLHWRVPQLRRQAQDPARLPLLAGCAALWCRCAYDYDAQIAQGAALLAALSALSLSPPDDEERLHEGGVPLRVPLMALALLCSASAVPSLWREAVWPEVRSSSYVPAEASSALRRYAQVFPGDEHAAVLLLQMDLSAALACESGCEARFRALEARVLERCAAPGAPPPFWAAAVRLAAGRGAMNEARTRLDAALRATPGDPSLRALDVALAEQRGRADPARQEALRWMSPGTLERARAALR